MAIEPDFSAWQKWVESVQNGLSHVSDEVLAQAAFEILSATIVLTAGNGGSAALASHMAQAIMKPDYKSGGGRAAVCLTDHTPILTAHANDGGWESALAESARPFLDQKVTCCVVLFSSSGKSENVVRLARLASAFEQPVVAFTGFAGEPLRSLAKVSLHVNWYDYEVVEPVHDALIHRVQQHLRRS